MQAIVPFAYEFYHAKRKFIISVKDFYVECRRTDIIPLRVDKIIIDRMCKFKLAVLPVIKW
jgi:hypothetical protein